VFRNRHKVLALDPENNPNIRYARLERIGYERTDNLWFHEASSINLKKPDQVKQLIDYLNHHNFTGLTVDPLSRLFATANENDNSEANLEMGYLLEIVRQTGVWCVAVHHTGKAGNNANDAYGRGASARLGAAHCGMTYRVRGMGDDDVDDDWGMEREVEPFVARLQVVKNRFEGGTSSIYLESFADGKPDRFKRVGHEDYVRRGVKSGVSEFASAGEKARGVITTILNGEYRWMPGGELKETSKASGSSESAYRTALAELLSEGAVIKKELGKNNEKGYALRAYVESQKELDCGI
jgi:hypothetical protein